MNKFIYLLVVIFLSSASSERTWYPIPKTRSCGGEPLVSGFCQDCSMQILCSSDPMPVPTENDCSATDKFCVESGGFSGCVTSASSCECPVSQSIEYVADPFDPTVYYICAPDGTRSAQACTAPEEFVPEDQGCGPAPVPPGVAVDCADIAMVPTPPQAVSNGLCTSYVFCFSGTSDDQSTVSCADGEVFDDFTESCQALKSFSCPSTNGYYVDSEDCSSYFLCIGGEIFSEFVCEEDVTDPANPVMTYFDEVQNQCVDDPEVCAGKVVVDCRPPLCADASTRIKIDCFSYYQCDENPNYTEGGTEDQFIGVLRSCPPLFPFSEATSQCAPADEVPECP